MGFRRTWRAPFARPRKVSSLALQAVVRGRVWGSGVHGAHHAGRANEFARPARLATYRDLCARCYHSHHADDARSRRLARSYALAWRTHRPWSLSAHASPLVFNLTASLAYQRMRCGPTFRRRTQ